MSGWDQYVENLMADLPNGGKLSFAAVFGSDGSTWAQSADFPSPTVDYIKKLWSAFDDASALGDTGLKFGDTKFILVGGEPGAVIRGKKGQGGCTLKKTSQAMLVGIYSEGVQPGDCNVAVENLGDYLIQSGY